MTWWFRSCGCVVLIQRVQNPLSSPVPSGSVSNLGSLVLPGVPVLGLGLTAAVAQIVSRQVCGIWDRITSAEWGVYEMTSRSIWCIVLDRKPCSSDFGGGGGVHSVSMMCFGLRRSVPECDRKKAIVDSNMRQGSCGSRRKPEQSRSRFLAHKCCGTSSTKNSSFTNTCSRSGNPRISVNTFNLPGLTTCPPPSSLNTCVTMFSADSSGSRIR